MKNNTYFEELERIGSEWTKKHEAHKKLKQEIQRMIRSLFLSTGILVPIEMEREALYCLRLNSDVAVDRSHLHGRAFRYGLARYRIAYEKSVADASSSVLGLVSGTEEPVKDAQRINFQNLTYPLDIYTKSGYNGFHDKELR